MSTESKLKSRYLLEKIVLQNRGKVLRNLKTLLHLLQPSCWTNAYRFDKV